MSTVSPPNADAARWRLLQGWTWLQERIWRIEHAYERSRTSGRVVDDTRLRIFFVLALIGLTFLGLGFEASRVALFGPTSGVGSVAAGPALARTDIVDRQGRLLAADLVHFGLYIDPDVVWSRAETRAKLLALLPKLSQERLDRALKAKRREFVIGGLTPQQRIKIHDLGLPGVEFEEESRRLYPLRNTAAHLIGFSDAGGKGLAGVESAFDAPIRAAAAKGEPVTLAMDLRVQAALEDELRRGKAAFNPISVVGIVTDIQTGEVLALASAPDFDLNDPGAADPKAMVNHTAASAYEMGSTFKILTFALGLDSGAATIHSTFDANAPLRIGNRLIHDYHAENRALSMEDIFIHSSNIGTARLALAAGGKTVQRYFREFGLFEPAKVELPEAARRPILPRDWNETTVASASFGHAISVTPLHVAAAVGGIMNNGVYTPLTVLKRQPGAAIPGQRRVVKPETSRAMLDLMRMNVIRGSGSKADAKGLRVGGKTGSADKAVGGTYDRTKQVSSFAAVFPTDGPVGTKRYLVLILYDEPNATADTAGYRTAGWNAAPTAGRVIDRIAPFVGVARTPTTPFAAPRQAAAPVPDESTGGAL